MMAIIDINELQSFLSDNTIPKVKRQPKTFLGIAKQPHYENVLSNIYGFFFAINEVHRLHDLFIMSLLQVINGRPQGKEKGLDYFTDFDIATEQSTKKGGRIDLLLSNAEQAIIIENKVYHHLNNDLEDYWNSVPVKSYKIGIVLSLNPINFDHPNFINITHLELMKKVMANSGNYLLEAHDKYVVFLKDFYQNIINLSRSEMDAKELDFYFNNQEKILEVKDFHFAVRKHISNQVEVACENLTEKLVLQIPKGENKYRLMYYQSVKNSNLMFTIIFGDLLKREKRLDLIVEMKNDLLKNKSIYKSISFTHDESALFNSDFYDKKESWAHFAHKIYNLSNNDIKDLNGFIVDKLTNEGLLGIFKKLEDSI